MPDSVGTAYPAWLQAMISQMYPGQNDMTNPELQMAMNSTTPPQGYGSTAGYPTGMTDPSGNPVPHGAPITAAGANSLYRPGSLSDPSITGNWPTPPPDPRRVGGAPAVANNPPVNPSLSASTTTSQQQGVIPGQQRVNRAGNNPNFTTVQYQNPNSTRNAPIYTAANFGNLFGGGGQQQPQQQPGPTQGALANPNWADPSRVGPFPPSMYNTASRMGPFQPFTGSMGPNRISSGVDPALYGG